MKGTLPVSLRAGKCWKPLFHTFNLTYLILRDGAIHLDIPFSRLLGKPPIMAPRMTPSTNQAGFISAILGAGCHVELTGDGHYNANRF